MRKLIMLCFLFSCIVISAFSQTRTIRGTVKDTSGNPLPNVQITTKNAKQKAISQSDGTFTIPLPEGADFLIFTVEGFDKKKIAVNSESFLVVTLKVTEMIYMPYGYQSTKSIVGAYSSVSGEQLKRTAWNNVSGSLQGYLPGLTVAQQTREPGNDNAVLLVRGLASSKNNTPYMSIDDGFDRQIYASDKEEIENVVMFKDPTQKAMYGFIGGNGVLMIESKRGKIGKTKIKFGVQNSMQQLDRVPEYLDSYNYAVLFNEARCNDGLSNLYTEDDLRKFKDGSSPYTHPNVNWVNELLKKTALQQKYYLNMTGGNNYATYYVNLSHTNQGGLFNTGTEETNAGLKQYLLRSNIDVNVTKTTKIRLDLSGRLETRNFPSSYNGQGNIYNAILRTPPLAFPAYFTVNSERPFVTSNGEQIIATDGKIVAGNSTYSNPWALLSRNGYGQSQTRQTTIYSYIDQKLDIITKGLAIGYQFSWDAWSRLNVNRTIPFAYYSLQNDSTLIKTGSDGSMGRSDVYDNPERRMSNEMKLMYNRTFGRHNIDALFSGFRYQYENDNNYPNRYQGLKSRLRYNYNDKYFLEADFSLMGTEQMPENHRYGFFPSIGAGWILSDEDFFNENISAISFMKLRASYGISGNYQRSMSYFAYLPRFLAETPSYFFGNAAQVEGYLFYEKQAMNPTLTWEKSHMMNVGTDIKFFNDQLTFAFDYFYDHRTDGLVIPQTVSRLFGYNTKLPVPESNMAIVNNHGFEVSMRYNGKIGNFGYFANVSFANVKNRVKNYGEATLAEPYMYLAGNSLQRIYGLECIGMFQTADEIANSPTQKFGIVNPGDLKYKDQNNDNVIDEKDFKTIGKSIYPEINYASEFGINYKKFAVSMLFQGDAEANMLLTDYAAYDRFNQGNYMAIHLGRWSENNTPVQNLQATYPRLTLASATNNRQTSTFWMKDASYLRLKNVEVSYTFDGALLNRMYLNNIRLFANGYNLLTWDNIGIVDPESIGSGNQYPSMKVYNLGVDISF